MDSPRSSSGFHLRLGGEDIESGSSWHTGRLTALQEYRSATGFDTRRSGHPLSGHAGATGLRRQAATRYAVGGRLRHDFLSANFHTLIGWIRRGFARVHALDRRVFVKDII